MTFFRRALLGTALALLLAAPGCARLGAPPDAPESRLARIVERGELRIGTSGDLPPLTMVDREGRVTGFEAELMRSLAAAMQLEAHFVVAPFAELLGRLEAGEVDVVVAGMTMTPERNLRVAFAGPYLVSGASLLARDPALVDAAQPAMLQEEGRRYAALASSTSARFAAERFPRARLVETPDYEAAVALLVAGEVDAVVADFFACKLALWRHPEAGLAMSHTPLTTEPLGVALPADDPLLLNLVQNYLNTLDDTGELVLHQADWLADGHWLERLP